MAIIPKRESPLIMGIINMSPDSFFQGSRCIGEEDFEQKYRKMLDEGADIIDIGACSTRPGSVPVPEEEEWELLKPALKKILRDFPSSTFSLDTFRASIVERAYDFAGDFIINDISAGEQDPEMFSTAARLELPYIAMHMRGTPATMQSMCDYDDVVKEVSQSFDRFIEKAAESGIEELILDPGFGFAKSIDQNYRLLNNLSSLKKFKADGTPFLLLAGISRKSMIYKLLDTSPDEVVPATSALHLVALLNGAGILRVHDVKEAAAIIKLYNTIVKNLN
jgi:dihydropteroate synthase